MSDLQHTDALGIPINEGDIVAHCANSGSGSVRIRKGCILSFTPKSMARIEVSNNSGSYRAKTVCTSRLIKLGE